MGRTELPTIFGSTLSDPSLHTHQHDVASPRLHQSYPLFWDCYMEFPRSCPLLWDLRSVIRCKPTRLPRRGMPVSQLPTRPQDAAWFSRRQHAIRGAALLEWPTRQTRRGISWAREIATLRSSTDEPCVTCGCKYMATQTHITNGIGRIDQWSWHYHTSIHHPSGCQHLPHHSQVYCILNFTRQPSHDANNTTFVRPQRMSVVRERRRIR